ncbi:MAG: hypothetical protein AAB267_03025, partial [Candidatus Desantisbacteria bacterium]
LLRFEDRCSVSRIAYAGVCLGLLSLVGAISSSSSHLSLSGCSLDSKRERRSSSLSFFFFVYFAYWLFRQPQSEITWSLASLFLSGQVVMWHYGWLTTPMPSPGNNRLQVNMCRRWNEKDLPVQKRY